MLLDWLAPIYSKFQSKLDESVDHVTEVQNLGSVRLDLTLEYEIWEGRSDSVCLQNNLTFCRDTKVT